MRFFEKTFRECGEVLPALKHLQFITSEDLLRDEMHRVLVLGQREIYNTQNYLAYLEQVSLDSKPAGRRAADAIAAFMNESSI